MSVFRRFAFVTLVAVAAPVTSPVAAQLSAAPAADVRAVVTGYAAALAAGDSAGAVSRLHADATIYESGHAETLAQYRAGHLPSDIAFASAVKRTTTRDDVVVSGDVALYTAEYASKGRFRNRDIDSHGTETMVLLHTPDGWKIRHIHWSSR